MDRLVLHTPGGAKRLDLNLLVYLDIFTNAAFWGCGAMIVAIAAAAYVLNTASGDT